MAEKIIDVHTHLVPPAYREALTRTGRLLEDGFPCPEWSAERHLEIMAQTGITTSILSISSPHQMLGSKEEGIALTRQLNDQMAALSQADPEHFRFAACLPLPEIDAACAEACRCLDELGAAAVKIPSNADGLYPGDPQMDPLMEELNRRSAVVLIHPCKPAAVPQNCFTAAPLPLFEFLGDTTRAVINLITQSVHTRWPNVRFVVPHAGSFLPPLVDRLAGLTVILAQHGMCGAVDPREALDNFYFDLAGPSLDASIAGLLTITTPDHLLFGGDSPYSPPFLVAQCIEKIRSHPLTKPHLDAIFYKNAQQLFRLP